MVQQLLQQTRVIRQILLQLICLPPALSCPSLKGLRGFLEAGQLCVLLSTLAQDSLCLTGGSALLLPLCVNIPGQRHHQGLPVLCLCDSCSPFHSWSSLATSCRSCSTSSARLLFESSSSSTPRPGLARAFSSADSILTEGECLARRAHKTDTTITT
ncbi:hypothetical protein E2C01_064665 [Portunus trituberculatus]|uniref:Uncharacterized protein n=1 Tax=Portunus trituberculatus TaxID=210409 RepID=A0A5B7HLF4_PORTR|nr:hypothetical protein [Portunus trituberculatus]